ncbi:MAG: hypothetical protein ACPGMR_13440 [Pontibacterium sp.]
MLRKLFSPILNPLEKGDEPFAYKPSHRKILLAIGGMFLLMSVSSVFFGQLTAQLGALVPIVVFFLIGAVCVIVGALGSDRAVAKIWGSR